MPGRGVSALLLASFLACASSLGVPTPNPPPHLTITTRGGMPGLPVIMGVAPVTNGVTVTWDGPSGYYQLYQELAPGSARWRPVDGLKLTRMATVSTNHASAFFRVLGPSPSYTGAQTCEQCHGQIRHWEAGTKHAQAFPTLVRVGEQHNATCLPCHTVGDGLPTGFANAAETPRLEGVQCENCHGPAARHAANPEDPVTRPQIEIASQVCGGCHTGARQPQYDEWEVSPHNVVSEDMNPPDRVTHCGRCHSGTSRLHQLLGLPLAPGDANVPITCAICHDPHQVGTVTNSLPQTVTNELVSPRSVVLPIRYAQLRNPLASTNDYSISPSGSLLAQYNPKINLCAQCHNRRGAAWTDTSRAPHHSPQYNMLLGTVGVLPSGVPPYAPAQHAFLTNQCVSCHMQSTPFLNGQPAVSGHTFQVQSFALCQNCHPLPEALVQFTAQAISTQIQQVKASLDTWATTMAPEPLGSKYGTRAWEYTVPGALSSGGPGPNSSEQALIPDAIKKARFDLYIVLYDGSGGVHNGPFAIKLLNAARTFVQQAMTP
jgi:Cytochrome c554 and c-prime